MNRRTKIGLAVAGGVLVLGAGGIGIAQAVTGGSEGGDSGGVVSGPAADQARTAATAAVPGGRAGTVRADTNEGATAYDVNVTKPDGSVVDVALDKNGHVLGIQPAGQEQDGDGGDDG